LALGLLAEALAGARVVVDVANSPSFEDKAVWEFFETSGRNLLAPGAAAGVEHHVALSVVGTDRLLESGYSSRKAGGVVEGDRSGAPLYGLYLPVHPHEHPGDGVRESASRSSMAHCCRRFRPLIAAAALDPADLRRKLADDRAAVGAGLHALADEVRGVRAG
jgi:hypothetical protein